MIRAALLLGLGLLAAGCGGGPGTFCRSDGECRTGLRCAGSGTGRGVCTYPPSTTTDAAPRDLRPGDAGGEPARRDGGVAKLRRPEAGTQDDARSEDGARSDAARPADVGRADDLAAASDLALER